MHWIALWLPEAQRARWAPLWVAQALRCTPRVAWLDEALVLEVSTSLRLWGGAARLRARLLSGLQAPAADVVPGMAQGVAHGDARPPVLIDAQAPSAQTALGLLRWRAQHHPQGAPRLSPLPDALPLHTLGAARAHLHTLTRLGLRSWGDVRALPRGGVSRRFGAALLQALDEAWGTRPESLPWLSLPDTFDERIELAMATSDAPQMLPAARHLLQALQAWLQARQLGVLAFALEWTLDWRRLHGQDLPAQQELLLRTAEPIADFAVLMRLVHERWQRVRLPAPARDLRLRSVQVAARAGASTTLWTDPQRRGEPLHQMLARLQARLGPQQVRQVQLQADHRPEQMQRWQACEPASVHTAQRAVPVPHAPTWLLSEPLPLAVHAERPHYLGPLQLLTRAWRVEAGWWDAAPHSPGAVARDYFVAHSEQAGLLWVFCERMGTQASGQPAGDHAGHSARWFLHGLYA